MWDELERAAATRPAIADLFAKDAGRADAFSATHGGMLFDYSKTQLTGSTLGLLLDMAKAADVAGRRDAMFAGAEINETEGRAVLHTALRNLSDRAITVDGADVMPGIRDTLVRMSAFSDAVRSGVFKGQGGAITDVVNIGALP